MYHSLCTIMYHYVIIIIFSGLWWTWGCKKPYANKYSTTIDTIAQSLICDKHASTSGRSKTTHLSWPSFHHTVLQHVGSGRGIAAKVGIPPTNYRAIILRSASKMQSESVGTIGHLRLLWFVCTCLHYVHYMVLQALSTFLLSVAWLVRVPYQTLLFAEHLFQSCLCRAMKLYSSHKIRHQRHPNTRQEYSNYTRNIQSHTARLLHCNECPPISTNIHHTKLSKWAKVQTTNRKQNTIRKWKANTDHSLVMSCPLSSYFDAGTACKYRSKLQKQHQKHQSCLELQDIWVNPVHWTCTSNDPHQAHQVPLLWVLPARTKLWRRDWPATDPALHWHRHHIQAHPRQRLRRLTVDQWTHRDPWSPWSPWRARWCMSAKRTDGQNGVVMSHVLSNGSFFSGILKLLDEWKSWGSNGIILQILKYTLKITCAYLCCSLHTNRSMEWLG